MLGLIELMRSFVLIFFCSLVVLIFSIHCPCGGSMFPSAVALLLSFHYHMSPLVSCCLCRFLLFNQIYCYLLFPIMLLCGIPLHILLSQLPHVHIIICRFIARRSRILIFASILPFSHFHDPLLPCPLFPAQYPCSAYV